MINRLRSASKVSSHDQTASYPGRVPPTKEDILSTMDKFGEDMETDDNNPEVINGDNNNTKRLYSKDSVDSESWDFADLEPLGISSLSNAYGVEWDKLFTKPNYRRLLRALATSGNLRSSRFRSICWKVFLEVIPEDMERWLPKMREWRNKYDELKKKLIINPRKALDHSVFDLGVNNPLSQSDESPWNQFFQDNELRLTIKQDVIRTYPRIAFFQSNQVRNLMVDVLFIYAKINPDISYRQYVGRCERLVLRFPEIQFFQNPKIREQMLDLLFCYSRDHTDILYKQGMHELLAPLIFVLHCDHQAFLHANEVESLGEIVKEMMDPTFLEHDAYAMLCQIMETVEPWYNSKDILVPKTKEKVTVTLFARPQDMNTSNAIVSKLNRVQDYILKKFDPELHLHLSTLDIAPQIYGIRWVRLLFGREFPMQDLLVLWDALFADGIGFDLVDYMFASMLLYIRDLLLASDYPQCLNCLMRYPPVADVHYLIEKARYLREPNNYPRPPNYTVQTVNQRAINKPQRPSSKANDQSTNKGRASGSLSTSFSSFTRKMGSRPKTLSMAQNQKMYKSSSVPMNLETDISPASPQYPQQKRGSSASLSQVEDTMFRSTPSPASLARLDVRPHRSVDNSPSAYTPDDADFMNGSVSQFATMPRARKKGKKSAKQQEQEYESEIGELQRHLSVKESMCLYCASKLDVHIWRLQHELQQQQAVQGEDEILLAIAGIKQVRDVLKGTLKFSQTFAEDENIEIMDNHYPEEPASTSPESDAEKNSTDTKQQAPRRGSKGRMFYMSSGENSEAAESPTDGTVQKFINKDVELHDYRAGRGKSNTFTEGSRRDSVETKGRRSMTMPRRSPNPLYKGDSSEDDHVS